MPFNVVVKQRPTWEILKRQNSWRKSKTITSRTSQGLISVGLGFWHSCLDKQHFRMLIHFYWGPSLAKGKRNLSCADGMFSTLSDVGAMSVRKRQVQTRARKVYPPGLLSHQLSLWEVRTLVQGTDFRMPVYQHVIGTE